MHTARALCALLLLGVAAGAAAASPTPIAPRPGARPLPKPTQPTGGSIGARAVAIAKSYLGVPYVWGGASPSGFDCSGLTMYVYGQLGIRLPHYTGDQFNFGPRISRDQLRPGDLVFFDGKTEPQHEGMYVGSGKFIHAPHTGDVVKISSLSAGNYKKNYVGAVRPYGQPPPIVFPVIGKSTYTDTFRTTPKGLLPGNDVIAPRKALVVAAEGGKVKIWTRSKPGGCMLYLYGKSGTIYEYLHLNNDLTSRNDNKGTCVAGTAYAAGLVSGQRVQAGQLLGYVGDSGIANGTQPHLHFEVHRSGKGVVDPYRYLTRAQRPLFAFPSALSFSLALQGKVVARTTSTLTFSVKSIRVSPGDLRIANVKRRVTVDVLTDASIEVGTGDALASRNLTTLSSAAKGMGVSVRTPSATPTLQAVLGKPGALDASEIILTTP
jgi:NlpC/P60 family protein/peptidase M23-like protein